MRHTGSPDHAFSMDSDSRSDPRSDFAVPAVPPLPTGRRLLAVLAAAGLLLALTLAILSGVGHLASRQAFDEVAERARVAAQFNVAMLRRDLDKHRALPFVLSRDPDLARALNGPGTVAAAALGPKLEALASGTGASVLYVLDAQGRAVASSNWRAPDSFVGQDYRFRPYYRLAMEGGTAEHFALGTMSRRPGLYLSHRIDDARGRALGVVVVKVEFDGLERDWSGLPDAVFVADRDGVVLLTSVPAWRFSAIAPVDEPTARRLRDGLQFGEAAFAPLPVRPALAAAPDPAGPVSADTRVHPRSERFVPVALAVPSTTWTFHLLAPLAQQARDTATRMQSQALVALLLAYGALALTWYRWRRRRRQQAGQAAIRAELEARVRTRTAQLQRTNDQLRAEMAERQQAEARLHAAQEELLQASRLSFLGQISAGVAHEINQPVAAIRGYADNAGTWLERGGADGVRTNLSRICALTERIGAITAELRAFARKGSGAVLPTAVDEAIDGALLLLGPRLRKQAVELSRNGPAGVRAMADRLRLEQVLINLLQNALDAIETQAAQRIAIDVRAEADQVHIDIADNGPGIAPAVAQRLFTPFTTSKPEGLGLGLVISRDIVADFGGALDTRPGPDGGTVFTITLQPAP